MTKKILINDDPWQTRVAIIINNDLQNIYFGSKVKHNLERSFFKGKVTKIMPGIQTAFVDIGQEKSGFLHNSEIDRELALKKLEEGAVFEPLKPTDKLEKTDYKDKCDITKVLKEGDEILIQVSKEPLNEKGAKLSTCFAIPGRFVVLMPNIAKIGVSKKIKSKEERLRLKDIVRGALPEGMGAIIRTTSEEHEAKEIIQDLNYLIETWYMITKKYKQAKPAEKIYEDIDLSLQIVRDYLDKDVELILVDNKEIQLQVYKFVKIVAPEYAHKVKFYQGPPSLFDKFNIEKQIEQALDKKVYLKCGGSIIIESTEAMTVIDVNTGRFGGKNNLEETILKTNLEAAEEVTRQLRLRNIGGLIVIDFIDMANAGNRQKLFKFFEKTLKEQDKFQSVLLKISEFGLVQMTRKRSGKTLTQELTHKCPTCKGLGFIKSSQNESFEVLRKLKDQLENKKISGSILLVVNPEVFHYLINKEYNSILYLEKIYKAKITITAQDKVTETHYRIQQLS